MFMSGLEHDWSYTKALSQVADRELSTIVRTRNIPKSTKASTAALQLVEWSTKASGREPEKKNIMLQ